MKRPSFQFYPGDWLHDVGLRACSLAARGLWVDMLCYMHQGDPYGYLTLPTPKDGGKDTPKDVLHPILPPVLARMVGAPEQEIETLLAELEAVGVFSRTPEGIIISRRMVRDENVRQTRAAGGSESQNNPNVPKRKDGQKGILPKSSKTSFGVSPSSSSSSSSLDQEHSSALESDTQGKYAGSPEDHGVDVAFAFMETFQLSGIAIRQAVAEAIDLRMKLTSMPAIACCEQIISEYQAYVDSQLESKFKKGEKTWLAECNKPAAKASSAQNPGPTPKNALNALERTRAGLCCAEGWEKRAPEEVRAELAEKWPEMQRRAKAAHV
jgi:hypothetical protein